ncbi:S24 family peptidase [Roseinatronobacter sp.]|uniref:S24 family peptidase n=1 Tax=Roseinatronobacter sp. TaxID=1945755 RepID=UPI0025D835DD|nr:S24 family peptidase [Roseibaca sp.]
MTRFAIDQLKAHVQEAVERDGLRPFAAKASVPVGVVRSMLGDHDPRMSSAIRLAEALGLNLYVGSEPAPTTTVDGTEFDTIRRFDVSAAAGDGMINPEGDPVDHLAFSKRWLASQGVSPGDSLLITVRGDSMEPAIYHGDLVMIDQRKTHIRSGKIYAFRDGDALRLKRIEVIPDTALILRSDNPKHPPDHRIGEAMNHVSQNILGQVVWSGHNWG